ncbi:hypothetical protein [Thalassospira xiamenensis]|uniref:hypothetical protein n=1 Tax=Thalassospira xiamenensis TaxID=220697 RepID=UPI0007AA1425|nr:hypothetical protein [Thalassospira xiamenensis]KZB54934.1 hypothetical protein AUP41_17895 [Thalassospira xiamenensis]
MGKKKYTQQLSGQIGESLVVAELGRRGITASMLSGNVPDIDILAWCNGKTTALQVKACKVGTVSVDARNYLDISLDGDRQTVRGIRCDINENLIYVFVWHSEKYGADEFYILSQLNLAEIIKKHYMEFLDKHGGVRPRNSQTTHNSVTKNELRDYRDNWGLIEGCVSG